MANQTKVYVVSESNPVAVFFNKEIADKVALAEDKDAIMTAGKRRVSVYERTVTTVQAFTKAARAAELAKLSPEQRKLLGLTRTPRVKKQKADAAV